MTDERTTKAATPLVKPFDERDRTGEPEPVAADAPVSTDENGNTLDRPDRGGTID